MGSPKSYTDKRFVQRTGKTPGVWKRLLDRWGVKEKGYVETVKYLQAGYGLSKWWARAVVTRYRWDKKMKLEQLAAVAPEELRKALKAAEVWKRYTRLPVKQRRKYVEWIGEAKRMETKLRRSARVAGELRASGFSVSTRGDGN